MPTAMLARPKPAASQKNGKAPARKPAQVGKKNGAPSVSLYNRIKHLAGVINGPGDLSTNPKYMEGYGRSRSH